MQTWTYFIEEIALAGGKEMVEKELNDFGSSGWEVVAVWPVPGPSQGGKFFVLFKKPASK